MEKQLENRIIRVDALDLPEISLYAASKEVLLRRIYEPEPGLLIAESPNVILRALRGGYEPVSFLMEEGQIGDQGKALLELCPDTPVYTADMETLSGISGFKQTRGVLCAMRRRVLPSVEEVVCDAKRIVVLEDVENPTNVGAIFRSAAALGIDAVLLTQSCADPLYRRAARVSMGTVFQIPWTYFEKKDRNWPDPVIADLQSRGFAFAAMALSDRSVPMDDPVLQKEECLAILMGNEENGLRQETIDRCDYTVKIPMFHGVDSLNVAAASAVAFWELRDRNKRPDRNQEN